MIGVICHHSGVPITPGSPVSPILDHHQQRAQWHPFSNQLEFKFTDFLYCHNQMSAGDIDDLMELCARMLAPHGDEPPFTSHKDLYMTIDDLSASHAAWECFTVSYKDECQGSRGLWAYNW
jgi:hypothetical protein